MVLISVRIVQLAILGPSLLSFFSRSVHPQSFSANGAGIVIVKRYYGRIAPRSGLTLKNCIDVAAGVVDRDYRGDLMVVLINSSDVVFNVNVGDRIAQLVIEMISEGYPI